ncbi:MAG: hypothetical protein JHC98_11610 [Thermoleophilaceae bacterium]|nr:hypothetical protein [Thermoleophilaceae bacterium]
MRSRLPLILIALTIVFALVAAGCGDDKSGSGEVTPVPALDSKDDGTTGSSGAASASAQSTLEKCIEAADALPDKDKAAKAKQACQDSYDNIKESSAKIDQATSDARAKCEEAANKIPNEEAKSSALSACAQFK